jgi:signal transduction histidine kinase
MAERERLFEVLRAVEEERARLSRELHDELGGLLAALRVELDLAEKRAARDPAGPAASLGDAVGLVERAAAELRRVCDGLYPSALDDLGLEPAVRALVREFSGRTGIEVRLEVGPAEGLVSKDAALCAYRVLQESLTNVSRHSGAREVGISLAAGATVLALSVRDDGRGFDAGGEARGEGAGLAGMRRRAELANGTIEILSRPSEGTRIELRIPLGTPIARKKP